MGGDTGEEIEAMKRLWPDSKGLCERRDWQAALWQRGLEEAGLASPMVRERR